MKHDATLLYFAGLWNLIGGAMGMADPGAAPGLTDPMGVFFFRAVWINVMAWGVGYILAGRMPEARVPVLVGGGVGKLAYCAAALALVQAGVEMRCWLLRRCVMRGSR